MSPDSPGGGTVVLELAVGRAQFKAAIPEAELVVISGADHVSNLERPGELNDAVRAFCRVHPLLAARRSHAASHVGRS